MYELLLSKEFLARSKDARKKQAESLRQAIEEIIADPYNARGSHVLAHEWGGFRAADFEGGQRFVFRICEECIQKRQESIHPLLCCQSTERNLLCVTFVNFGDYHKSAGKRKIAALAEYPLTEIPEELSISPDAEAIEDIE